MVTLVVRTIAKLVSLNCPLSVEWDVKPVLTQLSYQLTLIHSATQLCRAAHSSTDRRPSLLCGRTTSMEQAADRAETAAVDLLLPPPTENIFVSLSPRTLENRLVTL